MIFIKKLVQVAITGTMAVTVFTGCSAESLNAVNAALVEVATRTQANVEVAKQNLATLNSQSQVSDKAIKTDPVLQPPDQTKQQMTKDSEDLAGEGFDAETYAKYQAYLDAYAEAYYEGAESAQAFDANLYAQYQSYLAAYAEAYYQGGGSSYDPYANNYYGSQNSYYGNSNTNTYAGSDGSFGYVMVDGSSVTYGD